MPLKQVRGGDYPRPIIIEGDVRTYVSYHPDRFLPANRERIKTSVINNPMYGAGHDERTHYVMPIGTIVSSFSIPGRIAGWQETSGVGRKSSNK